VFKIKLPDLERAQLNELLVIIAFVLLIIFGSLFLVFRPQIKSINSYRIRSKSLEGYIAEAREKVVLKSKLLEQIEDIKETLLQYEKKLPREKDIPVLLKELTEIVELGDIEFISIHPQPTGPIEELAGIGEGGEYLRLPIQIKMRCSFHDFERFLFRLEKTRRFIKVVDIGIKGGSNVSSPGHEIGLTIEVYMYQEPI